MKVDVRRGGMRIEIISDVLVGVVDKLMRAQVSGRGKFYIVIDAERFDLRLLKRPLVKFR
jgi:hypothetical protein